MSIPLGTMLKRATTSEASIEEDTVNSRLLTVQMWMIYWIVSGCVRVAESVLLLHVFPLYSIARLCFSLWLIAPIVLNTARLQNKLLITYNEMQAEWISFSQRGCGLVYFQYVKPLMEGQLSFLHDMKVDEILGRISEFLTLPLLKLAAALSRGPESEAAATSGEIANYMQTFSTFSRTYFPSRGVDVDSTKITESTPSTEDLDEYDVLDASVSMNASVTGLKNRNVPELREGRRWFW